eukprot:GHRR01023494.1.p1 GENE.GHRR01023494.1~~GHRR01023494.1.p1  ORF type:complete len:158 (+),score=26.90 GHRR01023494.1:1749-2222(+)
MQSSSQMGKFVAADHALPVTRLRSGKSTIIGQELDLPQVCCRYQNGLEAADTIVGWQGCHTFLIPEILHLNGRYSCVAGAAVWSCTASHAPVMVVVRQSMGPPYATCSITEWDNKFQGLLSQAVCWQLQLMFHDKQPVCCVVCRLSHTFATWSWQCS